MFHITGDYGRVANTVEAADPAILDFLGAQATRQRERARPGARPNCPFSLAPFRTIVSAHPRDYNGDPWIPFSSNGVTTRPVAPSKSI